MPGSCLIFAEREFRQAADDLLAKLRTKIHSENRSYLLSVNETEYLEHAVSNFTIDPLVIHFDQLAVTSYEGHIPAERFPPGFNVHGGKSYPKQVIRYHLPFSGDEQLLRCSPNPRTMNSFPVIVQNGEILFDIIDFYGEPDRIKRDAESSISLIRQQAEHLSRNITQHNTELHARAGEVLQARKADIMKQTQVVTALGVLVRKAANIPRTFAVPATVRKPVVPRPQASTQPFAPEPALDRAIYEEILQTIHDTGRVFERLPSTYADRDEETLRDHLRGCLCRS